MQAHRRPPRLHAMHSCQHETRYVSRGRANPIPQLRATPLITQCTATASSCPNSFRRSSCCLVLHAKTYLTTIPSPIAVPCPCLRLSASPAQPLRCFAQRYSSSLRQLPPAPTMGAPSCSAWQATGATSQPAERRFNASCATLRAVERFHSARSRVAPLRRSRSRPPQQHPASAATTWPPAPTARPSTESPFTTQTPVL